MGAPGDNSKPRPGPPLDLEPFKRALVGCVRSIANDHELEVTFANDRPGLSGEKARLPDLPKRPTGRDVSITRGVGDSFALRVRGFEPLRFDWQYVDEASGAPRLADPNVESGEAGEEAAGEDPDGEPAVEDVIRVVFF